MDKVSIEARSRIMSRIPSKNTKPEIAVRSILHKMGYRFRLHSNKLPGKPDIVFPKHKTVIYVHGCFWHQHKNCKIAHLPKSRTDYWHTKLKKNVERDIDHCNELANLGWRVIVIWECEIDTLLRETLAERLNQVTNGDS